MVPVRARNIMFIPRVRGEPASRIDNGKLKIIAVRARIVICGRFITSSEVKALRAGVTLDYKVYIMLRSPSIDTDK